MTAKVLFSLNNGVDGEIVLRDNLFMDYWKFVFKQNNRKVGPRQDKFPNACFTKTGPDIDFAIKSQYDNTVDKRAECVDRVNDAILQIEQVTGNKWNSGRLSINSWTEDCNRVHRGFTTFALTHCTDQLGLSEQEQRTLKYDHPDLHASGWLYMKSIKPSLKQTIGEEYVHFNTVIEPLLHEVNAYVHHLENICIVSKRVFELANAYLTSENIEDCWFPNLDWNSKQADGVTDAGRIDYNYADLAQQTIATDELYSSDPKYNVYDLKNILGKDYEKAWFDYDDPRNWDVTNTFNTSKGGFEIRPHQSMLTKDFIKPWIDSYNHFPTDDPLVSPIAIGAIDYQWLKSNCFNLGQEGNIEARNNLGIVKTDLIE